MPKASVFAVALLVLGLLSSLLFIHSFAASPDPDRDPNGDHPSSAATPGAGLGSSDAAIVDLTLSADELYDLGVAYRHGGDSQRGAIDADPAVAVRYFTAAASRGSAPAMYELGLMAENGEGHSSRNFTKAVQYYARAATKGLAAAQFELGVMYANGHGVAQDNGRAIAYLQFAATGGCREAQMAMGYRYRYGYGVPRRCSTAAELYDAVASEAIAQVTDGSYVPNVELISLTDEHSLRSLASEEAYNQFFLEAAGHGNPDAMRMVGMNHYFGARGVEQDFGAAADFLQRAAAADDPVALATLGQMYAMGVGVPQDNATALAHFSRGAALHHPASINGLGFLHLHGAGVPQNYDLAAQYFRTAAAMGYADAQYNYGVMLYNGLGVSKDLAKAVQFFSLAAEQGQLNSMHQLGAMALAGAGSVPKDCERAVQLFKSVAEKASPVMTIVTDAFAALEAGDEPLALMLYTKAAEMGVEVAQLNVALMYDRHLSAARAVLVEDGIEGEEQLEDNRLRRMFHWYRRSARQGNSQSMVRVADLFYYGLPNQEPDFSQAVNFYRKAADHHQAQAYFSLGFLHARGIGLPQDPHLAKRFYDLALTSNKDAYLAVKFALWELRWSSWLQAIARWVPALGRLLSYDVADASELGETMAASSGGNVSAASPPSQLLDVVWRTAASFLVGWKTIDVLLLACLAVFSSLIALRLRLSRSLQAAEEHGQEPAAVAGIPGR